MILKVVSVVRLNQVILKGGESGLYWPLCNAIGVASILMVMHGAWEHWSKKKKKKNQLQKNKKQQQQKKGINKFKCKKRSPAE